MPIRITGMNSGLDTDSIVQELVSAYKVKSESYEKKKTKLEWTQDAWKDMNTKIYGFYSKKLSNLRFESNFSNKKKTTVSDASKATVIAGSSVINGTQTLKINKLATAGYLTGKKITVTDGEGKAVKVTKSTKLSDLGINTSESLKLNVKGETQEISLKKDDATEMTVSDLLAKLKEKGVTANFDETQQRFFLTSSSTGEGNDFSFEVSDSTDLATLNKLGLATAQNMIDVPNVDVQDSINDEIVKLAIAGAKISNITLEQYNAKSVEEKKAFYASLDEDKRIALEAEYKETAKQTVLKNIEDDYAIKAAASSAEIELNGATFTSDTNDFSINGLNITATGVTDKEMTITTATDVDGIYNMIKDFIKEYNELTKAMETAFNAKSSKGYEPLTDDEKEEMSDDEIEKWEKKIKDSLLRRDDTLSSILSTLSMSMGKSYEVNGKNYNLASFGIKTANYFNRAENESYAYHIDGDADDSAAEGTEDKLKKAIAEDPDAVMNFFNQLAKGTYNQLETRMKSTTLSSSYTVYNDKQMKKELESYDDAIEKWQEKLEYMEDYYYKKFSAMETALAKLQSQTTSFSQFLGG